MEKRELHKAGKITLLKNFTLFNLAGFLGFILGTAAFTITMIIYPNPTVAWLFANGIGGIAHFSANYIMQRQAKNKIVKNFIVFNVTGTVGFIVATITFAVAIIFIQNSTAAWLIGNTPGAFTHFILNDKAANIKRSHNHQTINQTKNIT